MPARVSNAWRAVHFGNQLHEPFQQQRGKGPLSTRTNTSTVNSVLVFPTVTIISVALFLKARNVPQPGHTSDSQA
jgi:hypothetical protein